MDKIKIEYNGYNRIELNKNGKIINISTGNNYAGCSCELCDRNRYDKESKTILCSNQPHCLKTVYKMLDENQKKELINLMLE